MAARSPYYGITGAGPWGDHGRILVHGMSAHLPRVAGRLQLERSGPYVPGVSCPGIGDVVVTDEVRARIESSGLSGCAFLPVDLARIVHIDWTGWDLTAKFPPVHPLSGEPENFILANEHDELLAHRMGTLWELQLSSGTRVARKASEHGRYHYEFTFSKETLPLPDFWRAENMRYPFLSNRAREVLGDDVLRWCQFHRADPSVDEMLNPNPTRRSSWPRTSVREMTWLGTITSPPDPPGIDQQKWFDLITAHPSLVRSPDREGLNPFTKAPMIYRADPNCARVIVEGAEVGAMVWAQDGSHRIGVEGDPELVEPLALEVASNLGGIYRPRE